MFYKGMKLSNINNTQSFKGLNFNKAVSSASVYFDTYLKKQQGSALDFIKKTNMSPDGVFKFLCHSTSNPLTTDKFVKELSNNPRKGDGIKEFLIKKMSGSSSQNRGYDMFMSWFHDEKGGYRAAYQQYYNTKIWSNAKDLNTLVKQSPNLAPWELSKKARELNKEFIFGNVPDDFSSLNIYRKLIDKLKNSDFYHAFVNARDLEVRSIGMDTMGLMTASNEKLNALAKPVDINVEGKIFNVKPIINSFSSKMIYEVVPEDDKTQKFILKFDPYKLSGSTDMASKFGENQDLRPDMPYLDAMIDFYLKDNKSPNAADILFYDNATKSVLYRATKGTTPQIPDKYLGNLYSFINYSKIKDIKKLGVELSDAHIGNFIQDENGILKLIDSGHTRYSNVFRPPVVSKHIILGNLCGRELAK